MMEQMPIATLSNLLSTYRIRLVSGSPRRRELLAGMGLKFSVEKSAVKEECPDSLPRHEQAMYLSRLKAQHPEHPMNEGELIIAADTTVWQGQTVLGKPADEADAYAMLRQLSGKEHYVVTGVTLRTTEKDLSFYEETAVTFAQLSDEEIAYYVDHYRPLDKAGAYGVQEWIGIVGVKHLNGCYYNVMGLPTPRLYQELKNFIP